MRISEWRSDVGSSDRLRMGGEQWQQLGVCSMRRRDDGMEQRVVLGEDQHSSRCPTDRVHHLGRIGRASCREGVCQYVSITVVAVTLRKNVYKDRKSMVMYSIANWI